MPSRMAAFTSFISGSCPRISWSEMIRPSSLARNSAGESALPGHKLTKASICGTKMMDPCCSMEEACQVWALPTNFLS